jgi:DNA repair ATPase RecN
MQVADGRPMSTQDRNEMIGRILRQQTEDRKAIAFIDAELSDAANSLKKAATQIECLISHEPADVGSALSRINMERILNRLAHREQLQRKLETAKEHLKRLGSR